MTIPDFPEIRPLEFEDKPVLDDLFRVLQPRQSELTFAGLWLFRHAHGYRLSRLEDSLLVLGQGYDGAPYAFPPLGGDAAAVASQLLSAGLSFYGIVDPDLLASLSRVGRVVEDRDNWDYLYKRSELATLPGNRYHKKKNRINYFLARHECVIEPLGVEHVDDCLVFLQEWGRVRGALGSSSFLPELAATAEAVRSAGLLGLEGLVALVAGQVKGVVIGERLNAATSACHFQKCDPFMDGLSQLMDREFNARLFTDCVFVNREQDLGEPGLRAAKLSYHPVDMVRKHRVHPR